MKPRALTYIEVDKIPTLPPEKKPSDTRRAERAPERLKNQIVQTNEGTDVKQAVRDAFLGERTQKVEEQTISRKHETLAGGSKSPSESKKTTSKLAKAEPKPTLPAPPQTAPTDLSAPSLGALALPILPKKSETGETAQDSKPDPRWADQGGPPDDYVPGIREADRTALNTKEFVFFNYYQRIRSNLDRAWIPILRAKLTRLYRSGRQLASDMDHTTKVLVIMNAQGEIVRVKLVGESGTQDLDEAAIKAFNEAGPFPNPPRGIVDANHEIHIPWEFILKT